MGGEDILKSHNLLWPLQIIPTADSTATIITYKGGEKQTK